MKVNLLLLLLTIQTHQICSYTTDMPDNGTEEMVTEMPNLSPLVTNMPNAPVSSGYMPQPTQENAPDFPDNHTDTDAQNQTLEYGGVGTCEVARVLRTTCGPTRNMTENECLTYGCCWDPTHDELVPQHCYTQSVKRIRFKPNEYVADELVCPNGEFLVGDANGDGYSDQYCFVRATGAVSILFGAMEQTYTRNVTVILSDGANKQINVADVNGDGRDDIVCTGSNGGMMVWEAKKISDVYDPNSKWTDLNFGFCVHAQKQTFLSDFTGDKSADALCVPRTNSSRSLATGDMAGTFKAAINDPNFIGFCHESVSKFFTGDFDADKRSDLVCRMNGGSQYKIALSDGDGLLVNEDFMTVGGWCSGRGDAFLVGDTNGDHHDDWICHHTDGTVCTKYNALIFGEVSMFAVETCDHIDFCPTGSVSVGDLNADGMDDLFCHTSDGNVTVAISTVPAPFIDFVQVDFNSTAEWGGETFCADKEIYVTDADGTNKQDLVCHNNKDGRLQRILGNSYGQPIIADMWNSSAPYRFCNRDHRHPEYGRVLTEDSNADNRQELFCHEPLTGDLLRSDVNSDGEFQAEQTVMADFCQGLDSKVIALDVDGAGQADFLCQANTQYKLLSWGLDITDGQPVPLTLHSWCTGDYQELLTGRYLNGRTSEILCHYRETGVMEVLEIKPNGQVEKTTITEHRGWCISMYDQKLLVGDWNGDRFSDLLCHHQTGNMKVLLNQADHRAENGFFAEEFKAKLPKFCPWIGGDLQVYDANGDGYDDLTCHTSTGVIQISESHIVKIRTPPFIYFSFDSIDGMMRHGAVGVVTDEDRGRVFHADGQSWANLGVQSRACITIPHTCENGGTLMVWIKVLSTGLGGYLTTVSRRAPSDPSRPHVFSAGFFIAGRGGSNTDFYFLTTSGTYKLGNDSFSLNLNEWCRITMVYDPASASGDRSGNKVYNDNQMYSIPFHESKQHLVGTGQMVLGRAYIDYNDYYANVFIDDLKMWNRMLTHEEIIEMGE